MRFSIGQRRIPIDFLRSHDPGDGMVGLRLVLVRASASNRRDTQRLFDRESGVCPGTHSASIHVTVYQREV